MNSSAKPMGIISAPHIKVLKVLIPGVFFAPLIFGFALILSGRADRPLWMAIIPAVLLAFGFAVFRISLWDLADEVVDKGDTLEVTKGGSRISLSLKDIRSITPLLSGRGPRIVIMYRLGGGKIEELAFCPEGFRSHQREIAEALLARARQVSDSPFLRLHL